MSIIQHIKRTLLSLGCNGILLAPAKLSAEHTIPALGESGTIAFKLCVDQPCRNGVGQENYDQTLIWLPEIFEINFSRTNSSVNLRWVWDGRLGERRIHDILKSL